MDVTNKRSLWENKGASPTKVDHPHINVSFTFFHVAVKRFGSERRPASVTVSFILFLL